MKKLGFVVCVTIALGVAGMVYALPSAAAALCPSCYGLREIGDNVYAQNGTTEKQRTAIVATVDAARGLLTRFWGPLQAEPRILACSDDACFQRLGGGRRRGMSLFDQVTVLSPRGSNVVIAAHELSMNELHHRIGPWAFATGRLPIWFDEGVAIYASNDLRYLAPSSQSDQCLVVPSTPLPTGMLDWNRQALRDQHLYAKAACQTSRWILSHGGAPAVVTLVNKIADGYSFSNASR